MSSLIVFDILSIFAHVLVSLSIVAGERTSGVGLQHDRFGRTSSETTTNVGKSSDYSSLQVGEIWKLFLDGDFSFLFIFFIFCSAGAGRTGSFCALSTALEQVKAEGVLDMFQIVKCLRMQRPHMVQNLVSFFFM